MNNMSQAFVKESDEQWLHEIQPTVHALIVYLSRQNNGIRVYEKGSEHSAKHNSMIHYMSNGLSYYHNEEGRWTMLL